MKKLFILPMALLFGAGVAFAGADKFEELDTNQDGTLSEEEVVTAEGLDFETADTNGDGSLSEEEFKAAQEGKDKEGMEGMEEDMEGGEGMEGTQG